MIRLVYSTAMALCFVVPTMAVDILPFLNEHCDRCHNAEKQSGGVNLATFGKLAPSHDDFELWESVLQQIESEEMPPKDPLPTTSERETIVHFLRQKIETVDWSEHRGVEHITLPRLNKLEYGNTLRDLLGIDFKPEGLLLDDGPGLSGFTNDRDALFVSPALAEQLFDAANYALGAALAVKQGPQTLFFEAENMLMTERSLKPGNLTGGGIGYKLTAGQTTLYDEVVIPADGWYRFTVRAVGIRGTSGTRLRIDDQTRADFVLADEQANEQSVELLLSAGTHQMTWNIELPASINPPPKVAVQRPPSGSAKPVQYAPSLPENAPELVLAAVKENSPALPVPEEVSLPIKNAIDRLNRSYDAMQMRIEYLRLITPQGRPAELRRYYNLLPERTANMIALRSQLADAMKITEAEIDRQLIAANAEKIESNQRVLAETLPVIGLQYENNLLLGWNVQRVGAAGVDWIRIEGPIVPTGSQSRPIFLDDPSDALADFLPRAFRRPLRDGELDRFTALYRSSVTSGASHDEALKLSFSAALTSLSFLFRDELQAGKLNSHQLANRLSYFLWMSMPDDQLRSLADDGSLLDETVLAAQVQRMVNDPKSRVFVESFLGQWLGFSGIGTEHVPDKVKFADFTPSLADAMKLEPVLVFENLIREGGSLIRLLDSNETFINDELAAIYGIPNVEGGQLRPAKWIGNERAGLLGMSVMLTASSTPNRTSPVIRGKWVLENLLGRRLAEAPADAGQLDDQAGERGKTLREELVSHRRNESCAVCHDKIDPIGFGLENFDAIGRLRFEEAGKPIDAAGTLPGGFNFDGPSELRAAIIAQYKDEFLSNVIRRLTSFALGRALNPKDEGMVRGLVENSSRSEYRADKLIQSIVLSESFRTQGVSE